MFGTAKSMKWKLNYLVGVAYLVFGSGLNLGQMEPKWLRNNHEIMLTQNWHTLRDGFGTANLLIGMTRNDLRVSIKGGATYTNSKSFIQVWQLKVIQILCGSTPSIPMDPVLNT